MKKLLLTLGTVAAVAAPVASVIACGSNDSAATITTKAVALDTVPTAEFDSTTGTATVVVVAKANDYAIHIAGEAAEKVEAYLTGAVKASDVKKVVVTVQDQADITKIASSTATVVASSDQIQMDKNLNEAVDAATDSIAKSDILGHDTSINAADFETDMVTRIGAPADPKVALTPALAEELLTAIGNPTKVTTLTEIDPVFEPAFKLETFESDYSLLDKLKLMITKKQFGDLGDTVYAALKDKVDAYTSTYHPGTLALAKTIVEKISSLKTKAEIEALSDDSSLPANEATKYVATIATDGTPAAGDKVEMSVNSWLKFTIKFGASSWDTITYNGADHVIAANV